MPESAEAPVVAPCGEAVKAVSAVRRVPVPDLCAPWAKTRAPRVRVALAGANGLAPRRLVHRPMGGPAALPLELAERDPDCAGAAGPARGRLRPRWCSRDQVRLRRRAA